jgi:hypothetical protein
VGGYAAASVSQQRAHGKSVGGASLVEANSDGGNRRDEDGIGGRLRVEPMTSITMGFKKIK